MVRSVPGSGDFGKVQERPGMAGEGENSNMAGSGFFQNFHHEGMGVVKKVRACAPGNCIT